MYASTSIDLIYAVAPAVLALIGSAIAAAGGITGAAITNRQNRKLAEYQTDVQHQQIDQQNAYNSPASQLQRYIDAGLNPNLIYGNGQTSAGNQSHIAGYDRPSLMAPNLDGALQGGIQLAMAAKDLKLKEQELLNKQEEQFNMRSVRMGQDLANAEKSVLLGYNPGILLDERGREEILNSKALRKYDLSIESAEIQNAYVNARRELAKMDTKYRQRIVDELLDKQMYLLDRQMEGADMDLEIQRIYRDMEVNLEKIGGTKGLRIVVDMLRMLFGTFIPRRSESIVQHIK